ncbi:MAG: DUF3390 domain-containing protein, partial [Verrucomicrobia bacterium]|nr:DUF3390 domain-containing protein [Verrucomicrobiota bacterium]
LFAGSVIVFNHPWLFELGAKLGWIGQHFHGLIKGTRLDPVRAWTSTREAPKIARTSFHDYWRRRKK